MKLADFSALDDVERCARELRAPDHRWKDWISRKDFRSLGEAYLSSRISLVCYYGFAAAYHPGVVQTIPWADREGFAAGANAIHVMVGDAAKLCDSDGRDEHVMFVDVVGSSDLPEAKISSFIRFYNCQEEEPKTGKSFNYATVRTLGFPWLGRSEGTTKRYPRVMGWETYSFRRCICGPHQPRGDVVQSGVEVVECVPHREHDLGWKRVGFDEQIAGSLRIKLMPDFAEISSGVEAEEVLSFFDMSVGPIDL